MKVRNYLHSLKRFVAANVLQRWRQLDAGILRQIRDNREKEHFWQSGGGYDRNIVTAHKYEEKLNYIHHNPVNRGLVKQAQDWQWSSAKYYLGGCIVGLLLHPWRFER